jgi:hypothetical protein
MNNVPALPRVFLRLAPNQDSGKTQDRRQPLLFAIPAMKEMFQTSSQLPDL